MSRSHTRRRAPRHRNVGRLLRFLAREKKAQRKNNQRVNDSGLVYPAWLRGLQHTVAQARSLHSLEKLIAYAETLRGVKMTPLPAGEAADVWSDVTAPIGPEEMKSSHVGIDLAKPGSDRTVYSLLEIPK